MRAGFFVLLLFITPGFTFSTADPPLPARTGYDIKLPPQGCTIVVTGYNSLANQTDDTPFITASQTRTRSGVVAASWLPFGAKVQFPEHFKDRTFVVEDRMPRRNACKLDIWFEGKTEADEWGIRRVYVRVLEPRRFVCPSQPVSLRHKCPEP